MLEPVIQQVDRHLHPILYEYRTHADTKSFYFKLYYQRYKFSMIKIISYMGQSIIISRGHIEERLREVEKRTT